MPVNVPSPAADNDGMTGRSSGPDHVVPVGREPVGDHLVDHPFVIDD
jgi:hypothetical protein